MINRSRHYLVFYNQGTMMDDPQSLQVVPSISDVQSIKKTRARYNALTHFFGVAVGT